MSGFSIFHLGQD